MQHLRQAARRGGFPHPKRLSFDLQPLRWLTDVVTSPLRVLTLTKANRRRKLMLTPDFNTYRSEARKIIE
jgi:hypothetical protein